MASNWSNEYGREFGGAGQQLQRGERGARLDLLLRSNRCCMQGAVPGAVATDCPGAATCFAANKSRCREMGGMLGEF